MFKYEATVYSKEEKKFLKKELKKLGFKKIKFKEIKLHRHSDSYIYNITVRHRINLYDILEDPNQFRKCEEYKHSIVIVINELLEKPWRKPCYITKKLKEVLNENQRTNRGT